MQESGRLSTGTESDRGWSTSAGDTTVSSNEDDSVPETTRDDAYAENFDAFSASAGDSAIDISAFEEWDDVKNNYEAKESKPNNEPGSNPFQKPENEEQDPESWLHEQAFKAEQEQSQRFNESKNTFADFDGFVETKSLEVDQQVFKTEQEQSQQFDQSKNTFAFVETRSLESKSSETKSCEDKTLGEVFINPNDDDDDEDEAVSSISGDFQTSDSDFNESGEDDLSKGFDDDDSDSYESDSDYTNESDLDKGKKGEGKNRNHWSGGGQYRDPASRIVSRENQDFSNRGKRTVSEIPSFISQNPEKDLGISIMPEPSRSAAESYRDDPASSWEQAIPPAYQEPAIFQAEFPDEAYIDSQGNNYQNEPPPAYRQPAVFAAEYPDAAGAAHDDTDGNLYQNREGDYEDEYRYDDKEGDNPSMVWLFCFLCCVVLVVGAIVGGIFGIVMLVKGGSEDDSTTGSTENLTTTFNTTLPTFNLSYTSNSLVNMPTPTQIQYAELLQETIDFYEEEFETRSSRRMSSVQGQAHFLRRFLQSFSFINLKLTILKTEHEQTVGSIFVEYSGVVEYQTQELDELSPDFLFQIIEDADYENYVNNYLKKLPSSPFANVATVRVDQSSAAPTGSAIGPSGTTPPSIAPTAKETNSTEQESAVPTTPPYPITLKPTTATTSAVPTTTAAPSTRTVAPTTSQFPSVEPTRSVAPTTNQVPTELSSEIYELVVQASFDEGASLQDQDSPQSRAFEWLLTDKMDVPDERKIQRYALATFYFATVGEEWATISDWLDTETSECTWDTDSDGNSCDDDDKMVALKFVDKNLGGELPPEVGMLSNLRTLSISNAQGSGISGGIPAELATLSFMETFELEGHAFNNQLPKDLFASWPSVDRINLESCKITGTIPDSVTSLSNLKYLNLAANHLNGTIPSGEIGDLQSLTTLDLRSNSLSGSIPDMLEGMVGLNAILLSGNILTGTIPDLSNLTVIEHLRVQENNLTGILTEGTCQAIEGSGATVYADCEEVSCSCCTHCCMETDNIFNRVNCSQL